MTSLAAAQSDHERLALCALALIKLEQPTKVSLQHNPFDAIADVDISCTSIDRELSCLRAQITQADAARALIRSVTTLDRVLSAQDDQLAEDSGISATHTEHTNLGLTLIRWPRGARRPIDRQSIIAAAMPNFRLLGHSGGGVDWNVCQLGKPPRAEVLRGLLGRKNWPLQVAIWPGIDAQSNEFKVENRCVVVDPVEPRARQLVEDSLAAIKFARDQRAHFLVLPELYLPSQSLSRIRHAIDSDSSIHPVVTVLGLWHQRSTTLWTNECVALDYRGDVLWRYSKMNNLHDRVGVGECLEYGSSFILRSTPAGWISSLICMDLFAPASHAALLEAAPNAVFAPSLSPKTSAHVVAAKEAGAYGIAFAVANRALDVTRSSALSFHSFGDGVTLAGDGPILASWSPVNQE